MVGKVDSAVACLAKAIKLDESNPEYYFCLGNALSLKDKYKDAIKSYKKAISLNPKLTDAVYNLGNAYFMIGYFHEAKLNYQACLNCPSLEKDVKFALAKLYIEFSHEKEENMTKAKDLLDELLLTNNKHTHYLYFYGKMYQKQKKLDRAKEYYRVSLTL